MVISYKNNANTVENLITQITVTRKEMTLEKNLVKLLRATAIVPMSDGQSI